MGSDSFRLQKIPNPEIPVQCAQAKAIQEASEAHHRSQDAEMQARGFGFEACDDTWKTYRIARIRRRMSDREKPVQVTRPH